MQGRLGVTIGKAKWGEISYRYLRIHRVGRV